MTQRRPLMPKATAAWLVDNTSLTFEQIADFCQMHLLEVKGIADGDVAAGIKGMDPISSGQLTREQIATAEKNPEIRLKLAEPKVQIPPVKTKRGPRYTPVSRRQDRPNAVLWLLRNHPELRDAQIIRLVGTTKPTILQIKERTHWNSANLVPQDPVTLGLCTQIDLDAEVKKAAKRVPIDAVGEPTGTLLPAGDTTNYAAHAQADVGETSAEALAGQIRTEDAEVLARLQKLSGGDHAEEEEGTEDATSVFSSVTEAEAEAEETDVENDGENDSETDGENDSETDGEETKTT